jgi:RNA polymerase sigma-70 factor, ECF subfamily
MEYEQFASLVAPHSATMARVAAALVGMSDAEDAAQEALLRAWRSWPSLRDAEATRAWLLRITVNVCHSWQAGHFGATRRRNEPLDIAKHLATSGSGMVGGDTDALDVRQAVRALPDELRRVVALRFYAGMDSTQIGAVLDAPAATIRTRLRRALELLRRDLQGHENENNTDACETNASPSPREGISNG